MRSDNVLKFTRATSAVDQSLPQPRWLNGRPSDSPYFEKQRNITPDFENRLFRKLTRQTFAQPIIMSSIIRIFFEQIYLKFKYI